MVFFFFVVAILGLGAENTGQFIIVQWPKVQSKHMIENDIFFFVTR